MTLEEKIATYKDNPWLKGLIFKPGDYVWLNKRKRVRPDSIYIEDEHVDPWATCKGAVLAQVVEDHERYVVFDILPHYNPNGFDLSKPYKRAVHKNDIYTQRILVKPLVSV